MNSENWKRVKDVLDVTLRLNVEERTAYLDEALGNEPELREEVESLLRSHDQADSGFLRDPAVGVLGRVASAVRPARIGRRMGAYNILEEIGRGGMGEVYRAIRADGEFDREVAVKLVQGGLDSQSVLERFRHERQILAGLDHPNVARLLDGGTTEDGLPYLVMELVDGVPIDRYCEIHKLKIADRVRLFLDVCAAVQYAHQRLVIHRDIKPGNILVSAQGVPKLLDFGIAKLTDPTSTAQTTLMRPMTPEYASPEQIRGETITTATDVYSLGVVLYQLLTGQTPHQPTTRSAHEMARMITEEEPVRPSLLVQRADAAGEKGSAVAESPARWSRELAGDLDNILLKALRKEPERRYSSVEQLGADLRRYLEGKPVLARKDSWNYRAGKFIRRHIVIVAATVIVILTLLFGMVITLREKRIAEGRFNDLRKLANSLIFEIDDSIADVPGSTAARTLLVNRALEYLDNLARQAKGDAALQMELATAYERVGDVLGYPFSANLGEPARALQSYEKATRILETLSASSPKDVKVQRALANHYFRVANVLEAKGDLPGALTTVRKGLPIAEAIIADTPNDPVSGDQHAGSYYFVARLLVKTGDPAGALENYRRAASLREAALKNNPTNIPLRTHLAADYAGMAQSFKNEGDRAQAIPVQAKAVEILREVCKQLPNSAALPEYLAEAINRLATFQRQDGKAEAALSSFKEAHALFAGLLAKDPKNSLARVNFAFSDLGIAKSMIEVGQANSADKTAREGLRIFQDMSPDTTSNRYVRTGLAEAYATMAEVNAALAMASRHTTRENRERWRDARSWYEKSLAMWVNKKSRGELDNEERDEEKLALDNIARCDAALDPNHPVQRSVVMDN